MSDQQLSVCDVTLDAAAVEHQVLKTFL
eukprot:COSAG02_NODE_55928_length_288_cov_0.597884_1_plen_27_part_10